MMILVDRDIFETLRDMARSKYADHLDVIRYGEENGWPSRQWRKDEIEAFEKSEKIKEALEFVEVLTQEDEYVEVLMRFGDEYVHASVDFVNDSNPDVRFTSCDEFGSHSLNPKHDSSCMVPVEKVVQLAWELLNAKEGRDSAR